MAGEGLKFTGQVVLSNRDLIKEAQDREVFKEQRLLFQQGQEDREDRRKKARADRNKELYGDFQYAGDVRPEYSDYIQNEVKSYRDWVSNNYQPLMDGDLDVEKERISREQKLNDSVNILKARTADYASITEDIKSGITNANLYKKIDDKYAYEVSEEAFLKNLSQGNFSPEGLSLDLGVVKNTPEQASSSLERIKEWQKINPRGKSTSVGDKYITYDYTDAQRKSLTSELELGLHPDEISKDSGYFNDYMDEKAQVRFNIDKKFTSNRDLSDLDPNSGDGVYNKERAVEYSIWRAKDLADRYGAFGQTKTINTTTPKDKTYSLTNDDIMVIEAVTEVESNTVPGIELKKSSALAYSIKVDGIRIPNPSQYKGWARDDYISPQDEKTIMAPMDEAIKANLTSIRVTSDNEVVGVMEYEGKTFIMPLQELESHIKTKIKGTAAEKLLAYAKRGKESEGGFDPNNYQKQDE